ncbi:hypothetical protein [Silvimonas sp.]|uniref:hypothetical protein n=1 Tax=Silvimonas sp. TaxID=2650811 RepID=UPI0028517C7F|nr:hypothetical protein [Silvimonas sp.]MDR3430049.1 hypothetical protein [Silvimonas sp.]
MQVITLGRVNVPAAGTPVLLSSLLTTAQKAMLPPSGQVASITVWPDPAATGKVLVKCQGPGQPSTIIAALPVPTGGYPVPWSTPGDPSRNSINFAQFSLDAITNGDGAYVSLAIA